MEPLSQLFLQQSFNSIQKLYIIAMHVPDQIIYIVTSAVWFIILAVTDGKINPSVPLGSGCGLDPDDSGMFTPEIVGGQGQVFW